MERGVDRGPHGRGQRDRSSSRHDTGQAKLPFLDDLIGYVPAERPTQPADAVVDTRFLACFEEFHGSKGNINEVDGSFFDEFVGLTEEQMYYFLLATFLGFGAYIKVAVFHWLPRGEVHEVERFLDATVYMAVRGNLRFDEGPKTTLCKAVGAKPTPEQQRKIIERIRADGYLRDLVVRVIGEGPIKKRPD